MVSDVLIQFANDLHFRGESLVSPVLTDNNTFAEKRGAKMSTFHSGPSRNRPGFKFSDLVYDTRHSVLNGLARRARNAFVG